VLAVEATRSLSSILDDHDVALTMRLAPHVPPIQGHSEQLREVILSIVQHSVDAMAAMAESPRALCIETTRTSADAVSLSIQDTEPVLSPQKLASLFDPFLAGPVGAGVLSLAICRLIVEHHGGRLTASSDGSGGVRFEVTLPASST
jgi:C4-dicarboxylate-specific signal transduction histidine kinase